MPEVKKSPYAPVVGEEIEVPTEELTLGGRSVTVRPMTMRSLENLVVVLAEPLKVIAEELISRPELTGGDVASGDTSAMLGTLSGLWQKHVVSALKGAPKLLCQTISVMINLDEDSPIVEVASLAEVWACWPKLNNLNDFAAIGRQIAGLFTDLMGQYTQKAMQEQQSEAIVEKFVESGGGTEAVLELLREVPPAVPTNDVQEEPAE